MIPIKLSLKNFLSYGEKLQTIDFGDYGLICLSGKNGNGKSAILDAITWAIWGEARKISNTAKADAGLIRIGQTQMMVSLEFVFNKDIYRVRREFIKTYGKPQASLDFEIFDKTKKQFVSLTDKTIRATQAKINSLLRLDFDTFVNSAFLRQGQSNEFSKKSPKERKEILASILGLGRYDKLKIVAQEESKKLRDQLALHEKINEQKMLELQKIDVIEKELSDELQKQEQITTQFSELSNQEELLKQEKTVLQNKLNEAQVVKKELELVQISQNKLRNEFIEKSNLWRRVHAKLLKLPSIEQLKNQENKLKKEEQEFRLLQEKQLAIGEKILSSKEIYNNKYQAAKTKIDELLYKERLDLNSSELEFKNFTNQLTERKTQISDTQVKIKGLQKQISDIVVARVVSGSFDDFEKIKAQFEKRRAFYQTYVERGNRLALELKELEQKKHSIAADNPACPLCEQLLTLKRKQFLHDKYFCDEQLTRWRVFRISDLLKNLKSLLMKQHVEIKKIQEDEEKEKGQKILEQELTKRLDELTKEHDLILEKIKINETALATLSTTIENLKKEIFLKEQNFEKELNKDPELSKYTKLINELEKEKINLNYNSQAHKNVQNNLVEITNKIEEFSALTKESVEQQARMSMVSKLNSEIKEQNKNIKQLNETLVTYSRFVQKSNDLNLKSEQLILKQKELHFQKDHLMQKIGSLKNEQARLEKIKKEFSEKNESIAKLQSDLEEYELLVSIFGKDGIQAILIEESIPEIEEEANAILSRLTDNKAQIFIESLRDLKKGGVKETLDIHISDSQGIRPYEMFSGGEAFRIDFSLRIAISKLLAKRAGTALQTLIIDEGFGSLDEEGLALIMQAIHAIQSDFEKIIVVSHLPLFKENFPVHFVVDKKPSGSVVSVVERG